MPILILFKDCVCLIKVQCLHLLFRLKLHFVVLYALLIIKQWHIVEIPDQGTHRIEIAIQNEEASLRSCIRKAGVPDFLVYFKHGFHVLFETIGHFFTKVGCGLIVVDVDSVKIIHGEQNGGQLINGVLHALGERGMVRAIHGPHEGVLILKSDDSLVVVIQIKIQVQFLEGLGPLDEAVVFLQDAQLALLDPCQRENMD